MKKFLVIQTAFIGDVILATAVVEKLKQFFPESEIDFLLRKGNESLLQNNPHINRVLIWDKKQGKYSSLFQTIKDVRKTKYDYVINLHRFASSGLITFLAITVNRFGFDKNPFSFCYSQKVRHQIGNGKHEVERNQQLITSITDEEFTKPKLYPSSSDFEKAKQLSSDKKYVTISPASVWFTKQFPKEKWMELIDLFDESVDVYLLGGSGDKNLCDEIASQSKHKNIKNFAGTLSFLQSAALMKNAVMNYANDSAPVHIASAINATCTEIFCSTIPEFGFGPLADNSTIIETTEKLDCRPCGIHGFAACPQKHFKCAHTIDVKNIYAKL